MRRSLLGAALACLSAPALAVPAGDALGPKTVAPPRSARVPYAAVPPVDPKAGEEEWLRDPRALIRFLETQPERLTAEGRTPAEVLSFAQVLLQLDQIFLAERLLGQAAAKWPEDDAVAAAWGRVLVSLGRVEPARRTLSAAIARKPDDATLHYLLGRALLGVEPRTEAVATEAAAALEKALTLAPTFQDAEGITARDLRAVIDRLRAGGGPEAGP